jgi:S1-C subfamily serine protease
VKSPLLALLLMITPLLMGLVSPQRERQMLLESEQNTINVFENSVSSVVNVSNLRIARRGWFDFDPMTIPAGNGSGFVWDDQGHIVTNFHVIASGDSFLVSFHADPKQYEAVLVGAEPRKDVAVLKLKERPKNLKPVSLGESNSLRIGQKAMAIGNPFGLDHTITEGIISATNRKIQGIGNVRIHGMIQTDASINPGNSGGPLFDSSGRVIGVNTMIFSSSGTSAGVGFAVPIDTIKLIVPQLIEHGKVIRPGLGIGVLPDHARRRFGIERGIVITTLDPSGGAAQAGLQGLNQDRRGRLHIGDVVISIDGKPVDSFDDIYHVLENYKIGDTVEVTYIRDRKERKTKVRLTEISSF